jgi:molybdenum cofactor cytidylyltransferase
MIFGSVPVAQAEGCILAHGLMHDGGRMPKGTILSSDHLATLQAAGIADVVVARLEDGDVTEDVAAERLAKALGGQNLRLSPASTGRVNVYASVNGLFRADRAIVDGFNRVDPAITLACLDDCRSVKAGDMVATIKIIPLAVASDKVEYARRLLTEGSAVTVKAYRPHAVSLIQTRLPVLKASVLDKTADLLRRRLGPSGSVLVREERVTHDAAAVAEAIRRCLEEGSDGMAAPRLVVMFGASAVCDAEDVLPQAMRLAGGKVDQVGLPVDPGNLLVLGHLDDVALVAAPGCARSPKENGFDWVLDRLLAGEVPSVSDLTGLGVGGLLMEIASRPQPREAGRGKPQDILIATVLLAAGRARRMGEAGHKLLAEFDGVPLVRRVAERILDAMPGPVVTVTGYRAEEVTHALAGLPLIAVENPDYQTGMAGSLKAGLSADLLQDVAGVMVALADMPGLRTKDFELLANAFRQAEGRAIVRAVASGKRGNPVILPRATFDEVMALEGDVGARQVIETCGLPIIDVEIGAAAHVDVDTPEAVAAAGGLLRG